MDDRGRIPSGVGPRCCAVPSIAAECLDQIWSSPVDSFHSQTANNLQLFSYLLLSQRDTTVATRELKNFYKMIASKSWLEIPADSHFSIANIPFGIISTEAQERKRPAIAIGDYALDLQCFAKNGGFGGVSSIQDKLSVFDEATLNAFAALGRPVHKQVRQYLQSVFLEGTAPSKLLTENDGLRKEALIPRSKAKLHLPMQIGDYTDFFAGINHAFNVRVFWIHLFTVL